MQNFHVSYDSVLIPLLWSLTQKLGNSEFDFTLKVQDWLRTWSDIMQRGRVLPIKHVHHFYKKGTRKTKSQSSWFTSLQQVVFYFERDKIPDKKIENWENIVFPAAFFIRAPNLHYIQKCCSANYNKNSKEVIPEKHKMNTFDLNTSNAGTETYSTIHFNLVYNTVNFRWWYTVGGSI